MKPSYPLHHFQAFEPLELSERRCLEGLGHSPISYARGKVIRNEREPAASFYFLIEGWVAAAQMLPDGRRQITTLHLPGDVMGTSSMSLANSAEMLIAVTDVTVSAVPLIKFRDVFTKHPRLAAHFMLLLQYQQILLADRLASVGRTSSESRVAAVLLDLMGRLEPLGMVKNDSFLLLVTQEQIGDMTGLTSVHVNRTMRELVERDLIARTAQKIVIKDRPGLERLAARPHRKMVSDGGWLPSVP